MFPQQSGIHLNKYFIDIIICVTDKSACKIGKYKPMSTLDR